MIKKTLRLFFLLSWLIVTASYAQTSDSDYSKYLNGKELLSLGKYGLAMQALKPLTSSYNQNRYTEYASFLYAVAAYHNKEIQTAKSMFLQIKHNYPKWRKMDEVNLWLVKIYLESDEYEKAFPLPSKIKDKQIAKQAEYIIDQYLPVLSIENLNNLLNADPSNKKIAEALADKIVKLPFGEQDRGLLENLVSVYELDGEKYNLNEKYKSKKKDSYQVAVLLPFMYSDLQNRTGNPSNEFVVELYEGMVLGQKYLKEQGIDITIHSYDTKKDIGTTEKLLELPEMQHMDLIIGPLYPGPVKLVSEFAFNYQINMVNPLSTNSEVIKDNPFAFLFMPTMETMGKKTAEYIASISKVKSAMIFYSDNEKDSTLAYSYKQELEGRNFNCFIKLVKTADAKTILDILTNTISISYDDNEFDSRALTDKNKKGNLHAGENDYFVLKPDSIGHIFIASDGAPLVANAITGLETRRDSIGFVGKEQWLDNTVISMESLDKLNTYLIAPTFVDKHKAKVDTVKKIYKETYNKLPSTNAYLGYETITTFGRMLYQFGNLFQFDPSSNVFFKGEVLNGVLFEDKNNDQYVPLIKFSDKEMVIANPHY